MNQLITHFFIAKNLEWLPYLKEELKQTFKNDNITSYDSIALLSVATKKHEFSSLGLSQYALLDTQILEKAPVNEQAKMIAQLIDKHLHQDFGLHVFTISKKYGVIQSKRSQIISEKIKKTSIFKSLPFHPMKEMAHAQVLIFEDGGVALSLSTIEKVKKNFHHLSCVPGGFLKIKEDKMAPSRAYRKIQEAQILLNEKFHKDQEVIDLGASPGGWSYIALKRGSKVYAIDRSALRDDLMQMNTLTFEQTDAFKYNRDKECDWVISDIICAPERIFELFDTWLMTKKARNFVFTIKFQGTSDYPILEKFKVKIQQLHSYRCLLRIMCTNKNEVTFMGTRSKNNGSKSF